MPTVRGLPALLDRPDAVLPDAGSGAAASAAVAAPTYVTIQLALDGGIPARVVLDGTRTLVLAVPLGQARRWLNDDPSAIAIDTSTAAAPAAPPEPQRPLDEPAARLTLLESNAIGDTVPAATGEAAILTVAGRAVVEVIVDALTISAGSLRSPGQYGSSIALRWRDLRPAPNAGPVLATGDPSIPRHRARWSKWRRIG